MGNHSHLNGIKKPATFKTIIIIVVKTKGNSCTLSIKFIQMAHVYKSVYKFVTTIGRVVTNQYRFSFSKTDPKSNFSCGENTSGCSIHLEHQF